MFSSLRRGLKVIDFYESKPNQYSEGTVSGACITIISVSFLVLLSLFSLFRFMQPTIVSDLIIDQKHLSQKLKVSVDIQFPKYPCSFMSLDIENILKVHLVNVQQNLVKFRLDRNGNQQTMPYKDNNLSNDQKLGQIVKDIKDQAGCRVTGWFEIDRVPGNFHFSCHGYAAIVPQLIQQGFRSFDMSHKIHKLTFGEGIENSVGSNSLAGFNSQKQIADQFMGISYTYFLDIIEHNSIDEVSQQAIQSYRYTARLNEVILAQLPLVFFKYETNPMTVIEIIHHYQWHIFIIQFVGILGGIFTVSAIIDNIIHSSIKFLLEKHRMGKLA